MSSLPIITEPNPILRQKSGKIKEITPEIKQLIKDMAESMKTAQGVGVAAPQIGKNIQLILVSTGNGPLALINPQITWKSLRKTIEDEGCLSCPNAFIKVKRAKIIYVKCLNEQGKTVSFRAQDFFARVLQHEIDHLKGILIVDK